jgi:hypothetical protein
MIEENPERRRRRASSEIRASLRCSRASALRQQRQERGEAPSLRADRMDAREKSQRINRLLIEDLLPNASNVA